MNYPPYGVPRLDSALRQARLVECGAEPSGWLPPSLKLRRIGEVLCVGWVVVYGEGFDEEWPGMS